MSVLVHAELDGEKLQEHEIVMGFVLLMAAGNDSTKATYCSGMRALMEDDEQRQLLGLLDPSLSYGAVEESLRMFPAFAHFRRTATPRLRAGRAADQGGREGRDVVRLIQPRRERATEIPIASISAATLSTRRSVPAAGTSVWAPRSPGWSCGSSSRRR